MMLKGRAGRDSKSSAWPMVSSKPMVASEPRSASRLGRQVVVMHAKWPTWNKICYSHPFNNLTIPEPGDKLQIGQMSKWVSRQSVDAYKLQFKILKNIIIHWNGNKRFQFNFCFFFYDKILILKSEPILPKAKNKQNTIFVDIGFMTQQIYRFKIFIKVLFKKSGILIFFLYICIISSILLFTPSPWGLDTG